jgi:hypothetical protein
MDKEKIQELFTKEIETLISEAELAIEETAQAARLKAKYEVLEKFDLFVKAIKYENELYTSQQWCRF